MSDKGLPIAYPALQPNTPVYGSDGVVAGVVGRVVAEPELDIFHGIMMRTEYGDRFVVPEQVSAMYERAVDLKIASSDAEALPTSA